MVIDAHNHPDWRGHDLEKTLANMDEYGIDRTVLLTWEAPHDEVDWGGAFMRRGSGPCPFERCLSYFERAPERFILGYAPDPRRPESVDNLQAAIEIHGVAVYGELKLRMMYDNPDALRIFRLCGSLGLPVVVHIDYEFDREGITYPRPNYWFGGGIAAFRRAVEACPETVFVGHAPGFWAHISGDDLFDRAMYPEGPVLPGGKLVSMMRECPNLCCDISAGSGLNALNRDQEFTREFIDEFQDRILYGRDCFDNRHREFIEGLGLCDEIERKILGGNLQQLLG